MPVQQSLQQLWHSLQPVLLLNAVPGPVFVHIATRSEHIHIRLPDIGLVHFLGAGLHPGLHPTAQTTPGGFLSKSDFGVYSPAEQHLAAADGTEAIK